MFKRPSAAVRRSQVWSAIALSAALSLPAITFAQPAPVDHSAHQTHPATTAPVTTPLADQVAELRAKVGKLETALQQKQMGMGSAAANPAMAGMPGGGSGSSASMGGMAGMPGGGKPAMGGMTSGGAQPSAGMGGMGMMKGMMSGEMGGMGSMSGGSTSAGSGMSGMDGGMMSMMGMSPAGGMGGMAMPTALPGFPGASHIYHIGSTGFFLDHAEHITLNLQQQTALNSAKEKALLEKAAKQREIDAAEQELWVLTASDQPDAAKIEAKVRDIEKLRGDQRLAFVRAVGEAAKVLTDPQRQSLLGQQPPQQPAPAAMPPM